MPAYNRRQSNELAGSVRLDQLRQLQSQLGMLIQDANEENDVVDEEVGLGESRNSSGSRDSSWERDASESSTILSSDDIESGMQLHKTFRPRRDNSSYDFVPTPINRGPSSSTTKRHSAPSVRPSLISIDKNETQSEVSDENKSIISSTDTATDRTVSTSGTDSRRRSSATGRRCRWSRSTHGGDEESSAARSVSRSLSRRRSSIFKKNKDGDVPGIDDSMRSVGSNRSSRSFRSLTKNTFERRSSKSFRHLPTYDFLQKDNEGKEGGSLRPNAKWWHGVFFFSLISMLACIITLWAPYPIGARMPSETIATMPWSNGCQGIDSCICPRETICADDLLSMIFLTIARSTAWFDYPLYMLLFLSKANNLNNFLQKTALRCWINFSDYHRVHSLFGIIVGLESTSHTFFHLLRWARRNNDIQVRQCRISYAYRYKVYMYVHTYVHQ